jgi:protein NrfD
LSSVLFLFLAHLGIGIVFTLLLVGEGAGVKFFRFNAGLAAVLLLVALALRPEASGEALMDSPGLTALVVATGALLFYWASIGRGLARIRPLLLWTTVIGGVVAVVEQGLGLSVGEMAPSPVLTVVSFLSSAALLGGASTAMILGHWYLVIPSMEIGLLQSAVKFHIGTTVFRVLVVAAVVWVALQTWQSPSGAGYDRYALSLDGVFLWQRVLFGLVSPALLSYLTWETAKIRSTQSATGILYVDFFTVVVGEVLAKYLLVTTRVPV